MMIWKPIKAICENIGRDKCYKVSEKVLDSFVFVIESSYFCSTTKPISL